MATGTLVVKSGRQIVLNRAFKETPDYTSPHLFKVGVGTTTPVVADTDLEDAVIIKIRPGDPTGITKEVISGYPSVDEDTLNATTRALLLTTEANGNSITEFGLFTDDTTPKMFSHVVFTAITKTESVQVVFQEKDVIS